MVPPQFGQRHVVAGGHRGWRTLNVWGLVFTGEAGQEGFGLFLASRVIATTVRRAQRQSGCVNWQVGSVRGQVPAGVLSRQCQSQA